MNTWTNDGKVWEIPNEITPRDVSDFLLRNDLPNQMGILWRDVAIFFESTNLRFHTAIGIRMGLG